MARSLVAAVAGGDDAAVEQLLGPLGVEELRRLALGLASGTEALDTGPRVTGPEEVCRATVAAAADVFGTTPDAVLGADRHRAVTDARAVAMAAARCVGLTFTEIGVLMHKDHTSVMYAKAKVDRTPRLADAATRIVAHIESR